MSSRPFAKTFITTFIRFEIMAILAALPLLNGATAYAACTPTLLSPLASAELDNGRLDRKDSIVWDFDWSNCPGATAYQLYVRHVDASIPVINAEVGISSFREECPNCYIIQENRFNWTWRVRAKVDDQWGNWSRARVFSVEPVNSDRASNCGGRVPTIIGTPGPDQITGSENNDVIEGLDGDDVIYGLGGSDVLCGGNGRDNLFGGNGHDLLYGGKGDDALFGGGGHDVLFGEGDDDLLRGDFGNDELHGGGGDDICHGGPDYTQDAASSCETVTGVP